MRRAAIVVAALAALAVLPAGCGNEDDRPPGQPRVQPIEINGEGFVHDTFEAEPGMEIEFRNTDDAEHRLHVPAQARPVDIPPGENFTYVIENEGRLPFRDEPTDDRFLLIVPID